ncbi:conserved phage C-terminal domain-containing protein [Aeromonas caviae]|uniref:conserved phage C-terminal domain-containing protein n=1 Tax=Aeromonas caviae TaxID=648 RepID=UPI003F74A613
MTKTKKPATSVVKTATEEVIAHLNSLTGHRYRVTTEAQRLVGRILGEGYEVSDIKLVIEHKTRDWLHSQMAQYLRPSTLFMLSKFDERLSLAELEKRQG